MNKKINVEVGDLVTLAETPNDVWVVAETICDPDPFDPDYFTVDVRIESADDNGELIVGYDKLMFICKREYADAFLGFRKLHGRNPYLDEYLEIISDDNEEDEEEDENVLAMELGGISYTVGIDYSSLHDEVAQKKLEQLISEITPTISDTNVFKLDIVENPRDVEYYINNDEKPDYSYGIDYKTKKMSMNGILDRYNDVQSLLDVLKKEKNCEKKEGLLVETETLKDLFKNFKLL